MSMNDILDNILPAPPAPRVHLVTLGVRDVAASTRFYETIGLTKSSASNEHISFFQLGPVVLSVFGREALAKDAHVPADSHGFSSITLAWNLVSEAAVDEAYERMVEAGASRVKPPQIAEWGGYSGYVADPDGHLWELAYNPHFPFDTVGALSLP